MVVTCDIQLENSPDATYYAGQVITGKITLTADKTKQVKAVNLIINGAAKTQWTESRGTNRRNRRSYSAQVDYINTVTCLLSPKASDQSASIKPGIHTFSFACHLPVNCPSSFEGLNGSIRYVIRVTLVRPWKFDQTFTRPFTVLSIIDLNYGSPLLRFEHIKFFSPEEFLFPYIRACFANHDMSNHGDFKKLIKAKSLLL